MHRRRTSRASWTIVDGDFVGGYPREAIEEAGNGDESTLADNDDWRRSMELLPGEKTFMGFVSIARILEEARKLPDAEAVPRVDGRQPQPRRPGAAPSECRGRAGTTASGSTLCSSWLTDQP